MSTPHAFLCRCEGCIVKYFQPVHDAAPTQGADARPVAWATKLPSGNLSSVRPSLKGAEKRTAAWNERFPNPPHAVTVALCECATRDDAPSDQIVPREVKRDSDFSVTVVFSSCRLASEFERQMIAASAPMEETS